MIVQPMDVLTRFPVRKSRKQKQQFRNEVQSYLSTLGYESQVEKGSLGAQNLVIGNPERAKYLLTAHYDTCAGLLIPNLITPCHFGLFLLYQVVLTALILVVAALGSIAAVYFTSSSFVGCLVFDGILVLLLILMLAGPANRHNANDNTSGVVTLLEIAQSMPEKLRDQVCFVLFDLEEAGLIGSSGYWEKHKKHAKDQIVLNLDCVGDGDQIVFFPTKKLRKDPQKLRWLEQYNGTYGHKTISVRKKGFALYPSDQMNFPYGVGICALRKTKKGILYLSRIHTHQDTILEETNVNLLRACLISMMTAHANP